MFYSTGASECKRQPPQVQVLYNCTGSPALEVLSANGTLRAHSGRDDATVPGMHTSSTLPARRRGSMATYQWQLLAFVCPQRDPDFIGRSLPPHSHPISKRNNVATTTRHPDPRIRCPWRIHHERRTLARQAMVHEKLAPHVSLYSGNRDMCDFGHLLFVFQFQ